MLCHSTLDFLSFPQSLIHHSQSVSINTEDETEIFPLSTTLEANLVTRPLAWSQP